VTQTFQPPDRIPHRPRKNTPKPPRTRTENQQLHRDPAKLPIQEKKLIPKQVSHHNHVVMPHNTPLKYSKTPKTSRKITQTKQKQAPPPTHINKPTQQATRCCCYTL
jgi:hypothetical protein